MCEHIRAPPVNSRHELVHLHSFENIDHQARQLCMSRGVSEHRCEPVRVYYRIVCHSIIARWMWW